MPGLSQTSKEIPILPKSWSKPTACRMSISRSESSISRPILIVVAVTRSE